MAEHLDPEFRQQRFGDGPYRHPHGSLAGAGALQNIPGIVKIVLDGTGQVGMSRTRPGHRSLFPVGAG